MPSAAEPSTNLRALIANLFATVDPSATPPDIIAWARETVYISAKQGTARPGYYDAAVTPYIAEIARVIASPETHECAIAAGAQIGKSQAIIVLLLYFATFSPAPIMLVQPSKHDVVDFANTRILPTIEDSQDLARLLPQDRKKRLTQRAYQLTTNTIHLRGAGSPAQMASVPVRYMFCDETDKYPVTFTREGDPVSLLKQRLKTYAGQEKFVAISTPTTEDGVIWRQFLQGDQREFFIQCPACGSWQPVDFKDVKFEDSEGATPSEIAKTARLTCRACGAKHDNRAKDEMVKHGQWRPTATPQTPGAISYHIQSLASPWVSLEKITAEFIAAKRAGTARLRAFINSELAQPWIDADENLDGVRLQSLEADYEEGQSFPGEEADRVRVGGVDVQKDYIVVVFREFSWGGSSGMIYHHRLATFAELADKMEEHQVDLCCIDCRFRGDEVFAACTRYPFMQPCQGGILHDGTLWRTAKRTVTRARAGAHKRGAISEITYDQSALFDYVAQGLRGERRWLIPRGTCADLQYVNEVTAKRLIAGRWGAPEKTADHYADAEKLCMLGALMMGYLIPQEEATEEAAENG